MKAAIYKLLRFALFDRSIIIVYINYGGRLPSGMEQ